MTKVFIDRNIGLTWIITLTTKVQDIRVVSAIV